MAELNLVVEKDVAMPMRDGTILRADVYRPATDGAYPVLLKRTPYDKSLKPTGMLDVLRAAGAGYVVVAQDVRGRFQSEGRFLPFFDDASDGYDTVEWCAQQPWSDGAVGMFGASYVGATQWLAAMAKPPHLRAIFPQITGSGFYDGWTHQGGAFSLGFTMSWVMSNLAIDTYQRLRRERPELTSAFHRMIGGIDDLCAWLRYLPLSEFPLFGPAAPYFGDWLTHAEDDDYWRPVDIQAAHPSIAVPAFNLSGWYDIFLPGTLRNFVGMQDGGGSADARAGQRLIIGPWHHTDTYTTNVGDVDFGVRSSAQSVDIDGLQLRFFDYWLKGAANGVDDDAAVRIFVMGSNRWRSEESWPPEGTRFVRWYLHSAGSANSRHGDGTLTTEPPGDESADAFASDPNDPVPTRGGGLCCWPGALPGGPFDQRQIEDRRDVLVFTSGALEEGLEIIGPITATVCLATSSVDADVCVKLVDVHPDGRAINLCDGILRGRYRDSFSAPAPLVPGTVYRFEVDLTATANVFAAGHRIRLEVAGSNFPRFDRNPQSGEAAGSASELRPAEHRVHHSIGHESYVTLPYHP